MSIDAIEDREAVWLRCNQCEMAVVIEDDDAALVRENAYGAGWRVVLGMDLCPKCAAGVRDILAAEAAETGGEQRE
jgi:tRNA(Ile)-lysidine synthase TilS/MesJ